MYLYEKIREIWKNKPDKSTPILAEDMMHIEDGIHKNSLNCEELMEQIQKLDARITALEPLEIVSWSDGTDIQITKIAQALRNGTISAEDLDWEVGQERTVRLSAINSNTFGNHVAQIQTLVILHKGGKLLESGQECSFVIGLKNCLANGDRLEEFGMNSSRTNSGGWDECRMRPGCNEDFIYMLPEELRPAFAKFQNITADGSGNTTKISIDLFALPAEKEVLGDNQYASSTAEADLFQFDYYATSANIIKKAGNNGNASVWWTRSSAYNKTDGFCRIDENGKETDYSYANTTRGIAPFGCI